MVPYACLVDVVIAKHIHTGIVLPSAACVDNAGIIHCVHTQCVDIIMYTYMYVKNVYCFHSFFYTLEYTIYV